jgi:hypothetical protein
MTTKTWRGGACLMFPTGTLPLAASEQHEDYSVSAVKGGVCLRIQP